MPEDFRVIKEFRSNDGVVGIITAKERNGRKHYTFAFKKEYDKKEGSGTAQTPWLQKQHIASTRALMDAIEEFIQHEEDKDRASYREAVVK